MKIEKSIYEGYLWYSNEHKPKVLINELYELEISDNANPFIIEGQLFDRTKSISIKYVDGKYIKKVFLLSDFKGITKTAQQFIPNRMNLNGKLLTFNQYWRPQEDEFCKDMEVLQPAELVFVGFKVKEK